MLTPHWDALDTRLFGGLVALLLAMTAIAQLLQRTARTDSARGVAHDFATRTRGWWLLVLVFIPPLLAGGAIALTLLAAAALFAWHEFSTITGPAALRRGDVVWTAPLVVGVFLAAAGILPVVVTVAAGVLVVVVATVAVPQTAPLPARLGWRLLGFGYCVLLLSTAGALAVRFDARWLFFTAVVVQVGDVLQYVFGKLFGRHPLAPKLSPKKTWEGFIGGALTSALLAGALGPIVGLTFMRGIGLGLVLTLAGVAGGLAMSAVKRRRGVKDFGQLVPGQGGLMDRLDSLCAACPVALVYLVV